jgi:hypothetical protein
VTKYTGIDMRKILLRFGFYTGNTCKQVHVVIVFCLLTLGSTYAQGWEKPFAGNDPNVLYYPDQNAVYFRFAWENLKDQSLVIKGKVPDARYFSYNLYNDLTKSSIAALADAEILPDEQDPSSYTVHLIPEGQTGNYRNKIIIPDSIKKASVFLRYYLPSGTIYANRPLPELYVVKGGEKIAPPPSIAIEQMNAAGMASIKKLVMANPSIISGKERKLLSSTTATISDKEPIICKIMTVPVFTHFKDPQNISAYNFNSAGNFPNKDNHYIMMPVIRKKKDDVLLVRFKAPDYARSSSEKNKDVRYYSLSQGDEYTHTSLTMHDEKLQVSKDGFIYVAVGNDAKEIREKSKELGINFMPWLYKKNLVLILRHMLPSADFKQSVREVPFFDKTRPAADQEAQHFIGNYALIGKLISKASWKSYSEIEQFRFKLPT